MAEGSLGRRIALSGLILVLLRLSLKLIGLISIVILFRLLAPEDFGIVALAMLVVGFVEVFAEFGFDQSLLRTKDSTRDDYHLVWSLNVIRGVVVSTALLIGAPFAAEFLQEPRLTPVIMCLALAPLLDSMQSVGIVDFAKQLQFQREFKLKVSQKLISFVITLAAALLMRNYWALVVGLLAGKSAGLVLGYVMHPYRPRFLLAGWRKVVGFSMWILTNNIVLFAGNQTDKVVVQRAFDAQMVGIVRIAEEVSGMVMELVWPIERALYAGYVTVANEVEKFHRTLCNGVGLVAALGVPLALGLGMFAEPAVLLLLGEKGRAAIPFVVVYVIHGALRSCVCGVLPAFMVINRPEVNTQITIVSVIVRLTVLLVGFPIVGLIAVPWSMVAGSMVNVLMLWWRSSTLLDLSWLALPSVLWRCYAATGLMLLAGNSALAGVAKDWPGPVQLLVLVPASAGVYLGSMLLLWWISKRPAGPEQVALTALRSWLATRRSAV